MPTAIGWRTTRRLFQMEISAKMEVYFGMTKEKRSFLLRFIHTNISIYIEPPIALYNCTVLFIDFSCLAVITLSLWYCLPMYLIFAFLAIIKAVSKL